LCLFFLPFLYIFHFFLFSCLSSSVLFFHHQRLTLNTTRIDPSCGSITLFRSSWLQQVIFTKWRLSLQNGVFFSFI
jgi:hypothetical protein